MKCAYCGKDFEPTKYRELRKYCSRKCYYKARYHREHPKQAKTKTCLTCGKEFETFFGKTKFCSPKCRNKWSNRKIYERLKESRQHKTPKPPKPTQEKQEKICLQCGKPFVATVYNKRFCSRQCQRRFNSGIPRDGYIKTCPICGVEFHTTTGQQKFCSEKCRRRAWSIRQRVAGKVTVAIPTSLPPKVEVIKPPEPTEPPEPPKPRREAIIPAAEAENRKPTVDELLDWIFSKERATRLVEATA